MMKEENNTPIGYYGSFDPSIKPSSTVGHMILDEYMLGSLAKIETKAKKDLEAMMKNYKVTIEKIVNGLENSIDNILESLDLLERKYAMLVKENDLNHYDIPLSSVKKLQSKNNVRKLFKQDEKK